MLEQAINLGDAPALAAEVWASGWVGSALLAAQVAEMDEPGAVAEEFISSAVEYLSKHRTPAAQSALRALSLVGEEHTREEAREAADALAQLGVPEPGWLDEVEQTEPIDAHLVSDVFGDLEIFLVRFRRPDGEHVIVAGVDRASGEGLCELEVGELEEDITEFANSLIGDEIVNAPVRLPLEQARERLLDAVDRYLSTAPESDEDSRGESHPAPLWPLLLARLDLIPGEMPQDGQDGFDTEHAARIAESFLASSQLPDAALAREWVFVASDWAQVQGREPDRCGPVSLSYLLGDYLSQHVRIEDDDMPALELIVAAWAHYTADAHGLGDVAHKRWDEELPGIWAEFTEAYRDPDSREHRETCPEAVSLRGYEAERELAPGFGTLQLPPYVRSLMGLSDMEPAALPAPPSNGDQTVMRLKITVRHFHPPLWRRVEVVSGTTLAGLHDVIQAAFGWDDDHLWVFGTEYGDFGPAGDLGHRDPAKAQLDQIAAVGTKLKYLFDFGDNWEHEILVEDAAVRVASAGYPRCIGGRQGDPIQYPECDEDTGEYIEADPGPFDQSAINARLAHLQ